MTDAIQNGEVGSSVRSKLNETFVDVAALQTTAGLTSIDVAALKAEAALSFDTVAALLADITMTYTTAPEGTIVEAGGFRYAVAVSAATDQHVTTAGGVKLYVQADTAGYDVRAFGAVGNGAADDRPAFVAMNTAGGAAYIPKPPVGYNVSSAINLNNVSVSVDPTTTWAALTDSGLISWYGGRVTSEGAKIERVADRLMVGAAAYEWSANSLVTDGGNSSISEASDGPAYLGINAQALAFHTNQYGWVSLARGSELTGTGVISFGSGIVNDKASGRSWGFIAEIQHETGAFVSNGFEVAAKNKSTDNFTYRPYQATFGVFGGRLVAGGDNAFGGDAANPSNSALIVIRNETSAFGWNRGIVFRNDALEGTDGSAGSTGTGIALNMARRHAIQWDAPDNGIGAQIVSNVTVNTARVTQQFGDNLANFIGINGKQFFRASHTTDGVNYLQVSSAATGFDPTISALGDDTDIDLFFVPKGAGRVRYGTRTATSDVPVTGYIEILDSAGTVRRLAVVG